MDLYRCDFDWQPVELIENYSSLIWTERYRASGEWSLTTYEIEDTLSKLPMRNLVCIDESREIMMIERYAIEEDEDGQSKLTVSGRSWERFTQFRSAWKTLLQADIQNYNVTWDILGMTSANRVVYLLDYTLVNMNAWDAAYKAGRAIPKLDNTATITKTLAANNRRVDQSKNVYEVILEWLAEDDLGIQTIRPTPAQVNLSLNVHHGADKTSTVIFDVNAGHFSKASYLVSTEDYISSFDGLAKGIKLAYYQTTPLENWPYGHGASYRQKVVWRDDYPVSNDSGPYVTMLAAQTAAEAKNYPYVKMFDGEVSPDIPYVYGTDYKLGDTVLCVGNYKIFDNLKISEYIRVQDEQGYRAYPALEQI